MRVAVVGSGPSAFYTIKYLLKRCSKAMPKIDILERLKEPYGLVRFGVAPDHPEVKNVINDFKNLLSYDNVKLHCGVEVKDTGGSVSLSQLAADYDAVLIATGAQSAKLLQAPGLAPHHVSARSFVLWYNGHPDFDHLKLPASPKSISVFGMGNVALDVARILSLPPTSLAPLTACGLSETAYDWLNKRRSAIGELTVHVIGRSCYSSAAFTNKEFRELLHIDGCTTVVDPSDLPDLRTLAETVKNDRAKLRGLEVLEKMMENWRAKPVTDAGPRIQLHFNSGISNFSNGTISVTNNFTKLKKTLPVDLPISSVGFQVEPISSLISIGENGGVKNDGKGRVCDLIRVYVSGWAKRGPRGNIASNISDAAETAAAMAEDLGVH